MIFLHSDTQRENFHLYTAPPHFFPLQPTMSTPNSRASRATSRQLNQSPYQESSSAVMIPPSSPIGPSRTTRSRQQPGSPLTSRPSSVARETYSVVFLSSVGIEIDDYSLEVSTTETTFQYFILQSLIPAMMKDFQIQSLSLFDIKMYRVSYPFPSPDP